ncbi:MAG: DNA cytosine methyltransferase [Pseudonocardiaceae bacterium]
MHCTSTVCSSTTELFGPNDGPALEFFEAMLEDVLMRAVGLFSGIGGMELGLSRAGIKTEMLCEYWEPAKLVLQSRFDAELVGDIRDLTALPEAEVVTAGFPCTDLSQVGRTAGIEGDESGLVREVFRLIEHNAPQWVVLENVPNMLTLHGGGPIRAVTAWFDEHGWNWAYRTVDSQHFGVRQRRRRVFVVASQTEDPRTVLFADEHAGRGVVDDHEAYGFYWTEGNRGIGWGEGVTPTLKGGSKLGIPSPPAIWRKLADVGHAIVRPSIRTGERLQGFEPDWTAGVEKIGIRWKLVGNAVTVPVAEWLGHRLVEPGGVVSADRKPLTAGRRWPSAAASVRGERETWALSEHPLALEPASTLEQHLKDHAPGPLSHKATAGFASRFKRSSLKARPEFEAALNDHIEAMAPA